MAANVGRATTLTLDGVAVAGLKEASITVNAEPIDISSDDDAGWRTLLDSAVAERSVDLSLSGVSKDQDFMNDLVNGSSHQMALAIVWPNGAILAGTFQLTNTGSTKPFKDAMAFDATFQSSGVVTFTPGS